MTLHPYVTLNVSNVLHFDAKVIEIFFFLHRKKLIHTNHVKIEELRVCQRDLGVVSDTSSLKLKGLKCSPSLNLYIFMLSYFALKNKSYHLSNLTVQEKLEL